MAASIRVKELPATGRVLRRPQHPFQIRHEPFQIQPFFIAPVLPGETMKNLLVQSRAVTKPIKNPLVGWWLEHYFFYIKHRDLVSEGGWVEDMVLDAAWDPSSVDDPMAAVQYYHAGGGTNSLPWVKLCLQRVVEEYFRDEGEAWDTYTIGGMPAAGISHKCWMDSVIDKTLVPDASVESTATDVDLSDLQVAYNTWEYLKQMALTNMSYEDWLATYGVRRATVQENRPELIRFMREWTYPSNTVDPATGAPSSACSWSIAGRGDKDRYFKEPGFLLGVTVARPKVYFKNQKGSLTSYLNNAFSWLPAIMEDNPATSLKEFASGAGALQATTNGYWVDMRDLFLYGEQFVNFALTETNAGIVALPTAALTNKVYPADADTDALFVSAPGAAGIAQDGIVSLGILGRQVDNT